MIRKANSNDIQAINILGEKLHPNFTKTYHIKTEIDSNLAIVLVSEERTRITGYLYALDLGDNIDLLSIYVDNNYRLRNVGTNLMNYLTTYALNKTITLEVATNNIAAVKLYEKIGFKIVGLRKKYYNNDDAYIMKWGI